MCCCLRRLTEISATYDARIRGSLSFLGTATYAAPEQLADGRNVDGRVDVYALGVLLFELLTGAPPFVADEKAAVLRKQLGEKPPPLREKVPTLSRTLSAFVNTLLAKKPSERPTMAECRDRLGQPWDDFANTCPFPGLSPLKEEQAALFFGRDAERNTLLGLLEEARTGDRRWIQVEGPSGVGKSSLLHAGVLPKLKALSRDDQPRWIVASLRPSDAPMKNLAQTLAAAYRDSHASMEPDALERTLRQSPEALREFIATHTPPTDLLLLTVEPLEELFTLGNTDAPIFDALISHALGDPDTRLRLLTCVRSDFLHRLDQLPGLSRGLNQAARYHLHPVDENALAQVITGMAHQARLKLSEGLADRMVKDARHDTSRLPLLSHTLRSLWSLSNGTSLSHEHYDQLGGVAGALAHEAEHLLNSLGEQGLDRARRLLLELVQVGRGAPDTRRPRLRDELVKAAGEDDLTETVLQRLTGLSSPENKDALGLRLLSLSGDTPASHQRVELVHETLLHKVPRIVDWIEAERSTLERITDLEALATAWEQANSPTQGLPTGTLLSHYWGVGTVRTVRGPPNSRVSQRAARFLKAAERDERRRTWGRNATLAALVFALFATMFMAWRATKEARLKQDEARLKQENLSAFLEIVDKFVGDTDWELSRLAHTHSLRKRMLDQFVGELDKLAEQGTQQADFWSILIDIRHRLADFSLRDGRLKESEEHVKKAKDKIPLLAPDDAMREKALNPSKQGKIELARRNLEVARQYFNESINVGEDMCQKNPQSSENRQILGVSYTERAELELEEHHLKEADADYKRALDLFNQNVQDPQKAQDPYSNNLRAEALMALAQVARLRDDLKAAKNFLDDALIIAERNRKQVPHQLLYQEALAKLNAERAALDLKRHDLDTASDAAPKAIDDARQVREGDEDNKDYALALAEGLLHQQAVRQAQGKDDEANRAHSERCRLLLTFRSKDPEDRRFWDDACPAP